MGLHTFFAISDGKKFCENRKNNSPVCTDLPIAKNSFFWDLQKTTLPRPLPWLNASDRQKHLRNPDFGHIVMKIMKQSPCTCHCKLETDKCLEIKSTLIHLGYKLDNFTNSKYLIPNYVCVMNWWIAKKCLFQLMLLNMQQIPRDFNESKLTNLHS